MLRDLGRPVIVDKGVGSDR